MAKISINLTASDVTIPRTLIQLWRAKRRGVNMQSGMRGSPSIHRLILGLSQQYKACLHSHQILSISDHQLSLPITTPSVYHHSHSPALSRCIPSSLPSFYRSWPPPTPKPMPRPPTRSPSRTLPTLATGAPRAPSRPPLPWTAP
jgi:hypothetical protein